MANLFSDETKKIFKYAFWASIAINAYYYINNYYEGLERDRRAYEYQEQQRIWKENYKKNNTYKLTPEQKQRQKDALKSGFKSSEPLPSEVKPDDEEMYNWIIDHPDYNGDYEYFKDLYESSHGDYDDYEK